MGTYTKVVARLTLKSDTPTEVVTMLQLLVADDSDDWKNIRDFQANFSTDIPHLFFTNDRWYCIFGNFTDDDECKSNWIPPRTIDVVSSVKNYDGLVDQFYNWIKPYIDTSKPLLLATIGEERSWDNGKYPMHILASANNQPKPRGGPYEIIDGMPEDTFIVADANFGFEPSAGRVKHIVNDLVKAEDKLWRAKALSLIENAKERASKAAAKRRRNMAKASQRRNRK